MGEQKQRLTDPARKVVKAQRAVREALKVIGIRSVERDLMDATGALNRVETALTELGHWKVKSEVGGRK